jgi:hypothetical protein
MRDYSSCCSQCARWTVTKWLIIRGLISIDFYVRAGFHAGWVRERIQIKCNRSKPFLNSDSSISVLSVYTNNCLKSDWLISERKVTHWFIILERTRWSLESLKLKKRRKKVMWLADHFASEFALVETRSYIFCYENFLCFFYSIITVHYCYTWELK